MTCLLLSDGVDGDPGKAACAVSATWHAQSIRLAYRITLSAFASTFGGNDKADLFGGFKIDD
jgi:hypothetical protein